MSTPENNQEQAKPAKEPARIRMAPSKNQKQRSKLKQVADDSSAAPPVQPVAPPPPPPPPASEPVVLRKIRLKRSGHMHEDLTAPLPPPEKPADEPEY